MPVVCATSSARFEGKPSPVSGERNRVRKACAGGRSGYFSSCIPETLARPTITASAGHFSGSRRPPPDQLAKKRCLGPGTGWPRSPMKPGRGNSGSVGGGMAVHEKRAPTRLSGPGWGHSFVAAARQRLCRGACAGMEFFCGFPEDSIEMPLQGSQCCEACGDGVGGVAQIPVCPLRKAPRSAMFTKKEPRRDCRGPVRVQGEVVK